MRGAESYRDYPEGLSHPRQARHATSPDPVARRGIRAQQIPAAANHAAVAKLAAMSIAFRADTAVPVSGPAPSEWPNRFLELGTAFFTRLPAEQLPEPHWVARSERCAELLGLPLDWWQRADLKALDVLSGNTLWPGMQPLASVYSGHQFGVWAGQLGDGRALWLGEMATPNGPMELQLKGAGRTPYSRMGDGRAVLRSSIREFLCSEAMAGLGIPTTRALCVTGSPLPVRREQIETAAVLTRVAPSFIRFGHFEHFSHHDQHDELKRLVDFVIEHHFPACRDAAHPVVALLEQVTLRTAELMADWQSVGFCHGVMNTDNMSILGLTIDYGPFGFLDAFDPGHICNHSDHQGRYAWARQPNVGFWNLHALAQALLPLIVDSDLALGALENYKAAYAQAMLQRWSAKLGLQAREANDQTLIDDLLKRMAADKADFTITFRRLALFDSSPGASNSTLRDLFLDREAFDSWGQAYAERLRSEASIDAERALRMNRVNPKFVLRNHLAEVAIQNAQAGDFSEVDRLLKVLQQPCDEQPAGAEPGDAGFPPEWAQTIEVSCSS
jgi:serine/tyrosine/threonine adenylyltransferase